MSERRACRLANQPRGTQRYQLTQREDEDALTEAIVELAILLNERHLNRLMNEYVRFYYDDRTHLALEKGTPAGRTAAKGSGAGSRVIAMPRLGGLHHRYDLAA